VNPIPDPDPNPNQKGPTVRRTNFWVIQTSFSSVIDTWLTKIATKLALPAQNCIGRL
jgi:hypothetical protein